MKKLVLFMIPLILIGAGCFNKSPEINGGQEPSESIGGGAQEDQSANIVVTSPNDGDVVTSPIVLTGEARVFENVVNWRLRTTSGDEVATGFFSTDAKDVGEFGSFEERIFIPLVTESDLVLEVFDYSAKDGSIQDLVSRNIKIEEQEKTSVNVFFVDPALQESGDCSEVDFEKRTVLSTVNVAELALKELLEGPESEWAVSEIPVGTTLNSVSIKDGVASVDFASPGLGPWSGGSCHVIALRAQIEQTLLQFRTVDSVIISVNGERDEILQP